jgi:hypothetical protein
MQRKSMACDFAMAESEAFQRSKEPSTRADQSSSTGFKAGEFVAVVEDDSSFRSPKVLVGQVLQCLPEGEVSLLWFKRCEENGNYYLVIDGKQWIENQDSLIRVNMLPVKKQLGQFKLTNSPRSLHRAVFQKN